MMFKAVEGGLKYKHFSSWDSVLDVISAFYTTLGSNAACQKFMIKSLVTLCELRDTPDFPYSEQLDSAFGAAITAMGPRVVLGAVPLNFDLEGTAHDFPRSWLLPVLKSHVQCTELAYFRDTMMPLAGRLGAKGGEYLRAGKPLQAKFYSTLQLQVWSLLPGFCTDPVDVCEAFTPDFAKTLGAALEKAGLQIRKIVCQALIQLVTTSRSQEENRSKAVARFARNFLPILFSLYTTTPPSSEKATPTTSQGGDDEGKRAFLLDCIKAYLSITSPKLVETQFSKLMEKLRDGELAAIRHLLLELAVAFSPYLSQPSLTLLFNLISPLLDSGEKAVQKKAYSCLEAVLAGSGSAHIQFQEQHLEQLRALLVDSLSTVSAGSKKARLRCLLHISSRLSEGGSEFISQVLPEVILCLKEVNEKARVLANKLITTLGYSAQCCFAECGQEESLKKYFMLVLAGLAGSPRMVSCTLLALAKLLYEFHDLLGTELIQQLVTSVLTFLSSQRREVVRSTLVLVKVIIGVLPREELAPHVDSLVKKILSWGESKRNHFRLKSRSILERLVRKFDHEMVSSYVPKKHQKLMLHIRKSSERRRRSKERGRGEEAGQREEGDQTRRKKMLSYEELLESSDEEGEEPSGARQPSLVKGKGRGGSLEGERGRGKAWIKEGADDEPVNFMDPVAVKRVFASDPAKRGKVREPRSNPFQTDKEGKLVITEEGEDLKQRPPPPPAAAEEEEGEEMEVEAKVGRKRRRKDSGGGDEPEGEEGRGWHGSGSRGGGIYRATAHKQDFKEHGVEYKAKRAKGDVKKKGQLDPYAYIPLNRQKLNRRKRAKMSGEFTGFMKKAVKGSAAGAKQFRRKR